MSEREYIVKCTEVIGISGNLIKVPDYIDLNSEIVRCRDCKHAIDGLCMDDTCDTCGEPRRVVPDFFCGHGEWRVSE